MATLTFAAGIAASVIGGVILFVIRQKIVSDRLREAIATEIRSTPVDTPRAAVMGAEAMETPIIDANLSKIHHLTKSEIAHLSDYISHTKRIRAFNERESDPDMVSISPALQEDGWEKASDTAEALESNITSVWRF